MELICMLCADKLGEKINTQREGFPVPHQSVDDIKQLVQTARLREAKDLKDALFNNLEDEIIEDMEMSFA